MDKTITPKEVLNDPEFYQLPEFERIKVLKEIDPEFASLPAKEQLKVVKAFEGKLTKEEKPFYEKAWRQFAYGSGELLKTTGEIINKLSGLITPNPLMQAQGKKIGHTIKTVGQETQDYWQANKEENKFEGTAGEIVNTILREIPSLVGFSPVMRVTGRLAVSALKPTSNVGKSLVESVGSGAGYTAVNLAGREEYDIKDAAVDTLIDAGVGTGAPIVGKVISKVWDTVSSEIKDLLGFARKTKDPAVRERVKKVVKTAKSDNKEQLLEELDNVINSENTPEEIKRSALKMKSKLQEDLPPPVKETTAETTDAYVDTNSPEIDPLTKKMAGTTSNKDFNKTNNTLTFTKEELEEIKKEIKDFNERINNLETQEGVIFVSKPKSILKSVGFPDIPITINKKVLKKKINKHSLSLDDLKNLPAKINNPVVVYKKPNSKNITVIAPKSTDKGILLSAIELNVDKPNIGIQVNDIRSLYFKNWNNFFKQLENVVKDGEILYLNKKKATTILTGRGAPIAPGFSQDGSSLINNLEQKAKTVKFYAGIPVPDVLKHLDNFELAIRKSLRGDTKLGFWDKTFNNPEEVFKNIGKEKYYTAVKKAFERQARLEKGYRKIMSKIRENLKTDTDKKIFESILHVRDKYKVENIDDIEKIIGTSLPENIKRAYTAFDNGMKWAARLLDLDKKVLVNKRYKDVQPIPVKEFKSEKAIGLDLETQFRQMLKIKNFKNPKMKDLAKRLEANPILYGYIPHVFHPYYVTDKNGNILATFIKEVEAEKFIKVNKDIVKPKVNQFKFKIVNAEELEDPAKFKEALKERLNRLSFHRYIGHKERRKGIGGWENFPYLVYKDNEIIGRFNTKTKAVEFANKNKGKLVELKNLPKKDIISDTEWYLHKVARYRAMEDIKPKLVSWFIDEYGLKIPKNTPIDQLKQAIYKIQDPELRKEAEYVADFINAVLGRPQKSEEWMNEVFKAHPKLRKIAEKLGIAYGDRAGLVALNKAHKGLTHIFLGLKPIQFVIQLSTVPSNTWPLLAKQLADSGIKNDLTKAGEYVAKALFDFATNKKLRRIALKVVSDTPTIAEINQYTGKTFSKGTLENISLFPLISGDRLARAIAFLAKYEQLKDFGYKGNKARLAKEFALQTNFDNKVYNTPPALRNPWIRFYMMFKPFLIKEVNFLKNLPWKYRLAGSTMLMTFLGTHAFLAYEILDFLGITDMIYQVIGEPLEETLSDITGLSREKLAEIREFGLLGALTGISLYQSMGLGDIYSSLISTASAPISYGKNIIDAIDAAAKGDTERTKELASRLLPVYLRRVKDGLDILTKGYIYRNGKPVIKGSMKEAIALLLGATPVRLQKFYNLREELKGEKDSRRIEREKLMKQMYEAYINNDKEVLNKTARQLIEKGIYPNAKALQQGFKSYIYSIKVPKELQLLAKPEYRQYLLKKSIQERKELLQRLKAEYEKEKDPVIKQAYIRAIRNVSSVLNSL